MDTVIKEKLRSCKLLVMDIDGTLTDNSMYYDVNGEVIKRFYVKDGMGINLIQKSGIKTAFLTSEKSDIVLTRAKKLKINKTIIGSHDKSTDLKNICNELECELDEVVYVGDDVNDLHAMKLVGFSTCPSDAVDAIKNVADLILSYEGGKGAVRELCEMILEAQNKPNTLNENW